MFIEKLKISGQASALALWAYGVQALRRRQQGSRMELCALGAGDTDGRRVRLDAEGFRSLPEGKGLAGTGISGGGGGSCASARSSRS